MKVWRQGFEAITDDGPDLGPTVATLGIFDGMHLGHQQLLRTARSKAQKLGLPSLLITFDPHPAALLAPEQRPRLLTTLEQRLEIAAGEGLDGAWVIPFSRDFSELSAQVFLDQLEKRIEPVELHVGRAFRFGWDRKGDIQTLKQWGQASGCAIGAHAFRAFDGGRLSSSRVRETLGTGRVDEVSKLLGRPYQLTGLVVEGERRGRHLGFPTANLQWEQEQLPANGVYVASVSGSHGIHGRLGLTNIGFKPTFAGMALTVETFLPDFQGDLYGSRLSLSFLHRLRGEQKFSGMEELREQIARDVEAGEIWWQGQHVP